MRKSLVVGAGLVIAASIFACGKTDVVGPTSTPTVVAQDPTIPVASQPVTPAAPQPATGASAFANVQIFGDLKRVNIVAIQYGITEFACRYTFGVDEAQTLNDAKQYTFDGVNGAPGGANPWNTADLYFGDLPQCGVYGVQIDVGRFPGGCPAKPAFSPGYLDAALIKRNVQPDPVWQAQTPVKENVGEWDQCHQAEASSKTAVQCTKDAPGVHSRSYDLVTYEVNSCSGQKREKSRVRGLIETAPCTLDVPVECKVDLCHVESQNGDNAGKWCYWHDGSWKCQEKQEWYTVRLYQCQNKHIEASGHIPGHALDYLGHCEMAKPLDFTGRDICYSITN